VNDSMKFFTDGEQYERLMGRWSRLVGDKFIDWLALPMGLRWLDVGCGNGAFTEMVVERCAPSEAHGIDPSEAQIAYASARDARKRALFRAGDAGALPYADASFDVAAMALVISFVPDPAKAVAEMVRVVRQGGWVVNYMWDIPGGGLPLAPLRKAIQALGFGSAELPPGFEVSRLASLRALWRKAGLEIVEDRRIDIEVNYADFDDFWQSNTGLGSPSSQIIRALAPADSEQIRDWLRQSLPQDAAGHIRYGAYANAVKGQVPR
jgi:ubiquinone/menaquinone biosynthesis C-methylase UbiE